MTASSKGQLRCCAPLPGPASYLLLRDGLLVGVEQIPLLSQRVVLQPRSGHRLQRRQRGPLLRGLLLFPLWTVVPLGLSLHSTCGVQGSDGGGSRHGSVGLVFCFPVGPRLLQQGARQVGRVLETWPPFLLFEQNKQKQRSFCLSNSFEESHRKKAHTHLPSLPGLVALGALPAVWQLIVDDPARIFDLKKSVSELHWPKKHNLACCSEKARKTPDERWSDSIVSPAQTLKTRKFRRTFRQLG